MMPPAVPTTPATAPAPTSKAVSPAEIDDSVPARSDLPASGPVRSGRSTLVTTGPSRRRRGWRARSTSWARRPALEERALRRVEAEEAPRPCLEGEGAVRPVPEQRRPPRRRARRACTSRRTTASRPARSPRRGRRGSSRRRPLGAVLGVEVARLCHPGDTVAMHVGDLGGREVRFEDLAAVDLGRRLHSVRAVSPVTHSTRSATARSDGPHGLRSHGVDGTRLLMTSRRARSR